MTQPVRTTKFPEGFALGMRVVTSAKYPIAYRYSPHPRYGTIVAAVERGNACWVQWDGRKTREQMERAFIEPAP